MAINRNGVHACPEISSGSLLMSENEIEKLEAGFEQGVRTGKLTWFSDGEMGVQNVS